MPALLSPFGRSKQPGSSGHSRSGSLCRTGSSASASVKDKDVKFRSAAPSCELFKMLTAMAAGKHASDGDDADLAVDPASAAAEEPVDDVSVGFAEAETEGVGAEPRISESTARSSTETAVDQWMDDTLHQTPRQRDILSARFTGRFKEARIDRPCRC